MTMNYETHILLLTIAFGVVALLGLAIAYYLVMKAQRFRRNKK